MDQFRETITPRQFAERCHVHMNTVYRWIRHGNIRSKKVIIFERHRYLIPADELEPYLKPGPVPMTPRDRWLKKITLLRQRGT